MSPWTTNSKHVLEKNTNVQGWTPRSVRMEGHAGLNQKFHLGPISWERMFKGFMYRPTLEETNRALPSSTNSHMNGQTHEADRRQRQYGPANRRMCIYVISSKHSLPTDVVGPMHVPNPYLSLEMLCTPQPPDVNHIDHGDCDKDKQPVTSMFEPGEIYKSSNMIANANKKRCVDLCNAKRRMNCHGWKIYRFSAQIVQDEGVIDVDTGMNRVLVSESEDSEFETPFELERNDYHRWRDPLYYLYNFTLPLAPAPLWLRTFLMDYEYDMQICGMIFASDYNQVAEMEDDKVLETQQINRMGLAEERLRSIIKAKARRNLGPNKIVQCIVAKNVLERTLMIDMSKTYVYSIYINYRHAFDHISCTEKCSIEMCEAGRRAATQWGRRSTSSVSKPTLKNSAFKNPSIKPTQLGRQSKLSARVTICSRKKKMMRIREYGNGKVR
ncbi:hypothetical protein Syun_025434 [Stephania yunnanensis]|uniref:Uncharacterized protein n=1 Tax=Stephania yunnanensis TaxID=152371 RepID=A0AAP0ES60_9MAGN